MKGTNTETGRVNTGSERTPGGMIRGTMITGGRMRRKTRTSIVPPLGVILCQIGNVLLPASRGAGRGKRLDLPSSL